MKNLLIFCVLLSAGAAYADLGGGEITTELKLLQDGVFEIPTAEDLEEYFGGARCECAAAGEDEGSFLLEITLNGATNPPSQPVDIWVGSGCDVDDRVMREENCELVHTVLDIEELTSEYEVFIPADALMFPNDVCASTQAVNSVWIMVDEGGNQDYNEIFFIEVGYDTQAPPEPENIEVVGGEERLRVTFDLPSSRSEDIDGYQVWCRRVDNGEEGNSANVDPEYQTPGLLCGEPTMETFPVDIEDTSFLCATQDSGSATEVEVNGLENGVEYEVTLITYDHAQNFVVSESITGTPVPVLDFWEWYQQEGGEAESGFCLSVHAFSEGGPTQTLRSYRDGVLAQSWLGRSLIGKYYDTMPSLEGALPVWAARVVLLPAVWFAWLSSNAAWLLLGAFAFAMARSRVFRPKAFLGAVLALASTVWAEETQTPADISPETTETSPAEDTNQEPPTPDATPVSEDKDLSNSGEIVVPETVQTPAENAPTTSPDRPQPLGGWGTDPYWSGLDNSLAQVMRPRWNVGFRFGPYKPDVDAEFSGTGPYETFFGSKHTYVGAVDVDYFLLYPMGQLGITGTVGYTKRTAKTLALDAMGNPEVDDDGNLVRTGETSTLGVMPMSLGAVYRFTALDEELGIPIVPFVKGELAYYVWWILDPTGRFSITGPPKKKARGATTGYVFTAGLSIRLERIDKDAAYSLQESMGVEHIGLYAEYRWAKVEGLTGNRLSVGDQIWSAGAHFEF